MTPAGWAAAIAVLLVVMNLASQAIALWRLRRPLQRSALLAELPPVTIVRPVRGIEAFSRETAVSGLELDYPRYTTIFCVADGEDPIVPLIEELIGLYGADKVSLLIGDISVSANPKLNNCVRGWEAAATDWVILADSNVLMPKDYIQRMLAAWRPGSGLVCSTPAGSGPNGAFAPPPTPWASVASKRWSRPITASTSSISRTARPRVTSSRRGSRRSGPKVRSSRSQMTARIGRRAFP